MTDEPHEVPQGIVCLKWTYGKHFFHEHAVFTGLNHATSRAMDLILRAQGAVKAIDEGSMPDAQTVSDIEKIFRHPGMDDH